MTISEIFAAHGEPYFRAGETRVIARLLEGGPQVLATGGGAFIVPETRENIRRLGVSVWLKAELPLLMRRVLKKNNRPLLMNDPEASMKRLMTARYPIYATADITVESREVPHDVIVGEVIDALTARLVPRENASTALNPNEAT
jgi:shikimate kinase